MFGILEGSFNPDGQLSLAGLCQRLDRASESMCNRELPPIQSNASQLVVGNSASLQKILTIVSPSLPL